MIQLTQFKLTNNSGSIINIISLDNLVLSANAVDLDIFNPINGGFVMSDVMNNDELEGLLKSGNISIKEQNDLPLQSTILLYGQPNLYYSDRITQQEDNFGSTFFDLWQNARYINLEPQNANQFISGFEATWHGDIKIIRNSSSNRELTFLNNNNNSLAPNRILCPESNTYKLKKSSSAVIMYDINLLRWVVISDERP